MLSQSFHVNEKANYKSLNPQDNQFRFQIRNHPEGELSRFLSRLQPGARIKLRGPYQEFEYRNGLEQAVFWLEEQGYPLLYRWRTHCSKIDQRALRPG